MAKHTKAQKSTRQDGRERPRPKPVDSPKYKPKAKHTTASELIQRGLADRTFI